MMVVYLLLPWIDRLIKRLEEQTGQAAPTDEPAAVACDHAADPLTKEQLAAIRAHAAEHMPKGRVLAEASLFPPDGPQR